MNFRQAQRTKDVKFEGSPRNSSTSAWSVDKKQGVLIPSRSAIWSKMSQNAFSNRILVL